VEVIVANKPRQQQRQAESEPYKQQQEIVIERSQAFSTAAAGAN
jgi:hypothetical protein